MTKVKEEFLGRFKIGDFITCDKWVNDDTLIDFISVTNVDDPYQFTCVDSNGNVHTFDYDYEEFISFSHPKVNSKAKDCEVIDKPTEYDNINPTHYKNLSKQPWEMMIDVWGAEAFVKFCEMNAFKYRMRMGSKPGNDVNQELDKARWYEDKARSIRESGLIK